MKINLYTHIKESVSLFKSERFLSSITAQQKQILAIALAALGCAVACYAIYRCFFADKKVKKIASDEHPVRNLANKPEKDEICSPSKKIEKKELSSLKDAALEEKKTQLSDVLKEETSTLNHQHQGSPVLEDSILEETNIARDIEDDLEEDKRTSQDLLQEETNTPIDDVALYEESPALLEDDFLQIDREPQFDKKVHQERLIKAVNEAKNIEDLEPYLQNDEDMIQVLNARTAFISSQAIQRQANHLSNDPILHRLLHGMPHEKEKNELEKEKDERKAFQVRHVKGHLNRLSLCPTLSFNRCSILYLPLTKDEIIEFIKDLDFNEQTHGSLYDTTGYQTLRRCGCSYIDDMLKSICQYYQKPVIFRSDELNAKRIAICKELFADWSFSFDDIFKDALRHHDPELLQAVFEMGYQYPSLTTADDELEKHIEEVSRNSDLLQYLKENTYEDYDNLESTINLLINKGLLLSKYFPKSKSIHDFIMTNCKPHKEAFLNILDSPECDLQKAIEIARNTGSLDASVGNLIDTVYSALNGYHQRGLQACIFLHDHYSDLETDVKRVLEDYLQIPFYRQVKQKYFCDVMP